MRIITKRMIFSVISLLIILATIGFFLRSTSAQSGTPALDAMIATGKAQLFTKTIFGGLDAYKTFQSAANSSDYSATTTTNDQKVKIRTYLAVTRMLDVIFRNDGGAEANTLMELLEKYGITRTGNDFESLNVNPMKDGYGGFIIPSTAPNSEAIRAFLAGPFLTAINASIADMDIVIALLVPSETKEIISKDLTNNDKDVEVDDGDYYLFRAMLKAMKAYVLTLSAYDMNVNIREIASLANMNAINMKELFDRNTQLLKVLTTAGTPSYNGAAKLGEARATLIGAIDDGIMASDKIRADNDLTDGAEELFSLTEDADRYNEELLRENMVLMKDSLEHNQAVTFIEKRVGVEYDVYGAASFSTTEPSWWEKCYHPERNVDYTYLGTATTTETFYGQYNFYIITTKAGHMAPVDAVQGSVSTTFSIKASGNTTNYGNINSGTPNGNYALVGGLYGGSSNGFVVISPSVVITSLTVSLANGTGVVSDVVPIVTYGKASVNLSPIFGDGTTAPNLRDLLPDFTGYYSGNEIIAGTVGHGLGNDPTLGGIFPTYTQGGISLPYIQDKWSREFDSLQPAGPVTIPTILPATIKVQDSSVTDWGSIQPIFTDVTGDARGNTESDLSKLYLANDGSNLYIRMDMAGAIPLTGFEQLNYIFNLKMDPGPDGSGDVQIHVSYNPGGSPWHASIVKWDSNGNYYEAAQLSSFQVFGNTIEIAAPLAQVGETGGRFIAVSTSKWWGATIDNNYTSLQISPAASVTGTLTVPQYDGTGLIHIGIFRYDGIYDTHPRKRLGGTTIYPGQYSAGMTYTVGNLPLGVNVFVAAFWDKDLTGARSAGDVFTRTNFFQTLEGNTGKALNTTLSPVITTSANPQLYGASVFKEDRFNSNDEFTTTRTYYLGASVLGASPADVSVVVSGPGGFQRTLTPENALLFNVTNNLHFLSFSNIPVDTDATLPGGLPEGNYTFSLLDATGRTMAEQRRWYSSSVTVPAMPAISSFKVNNDFLAQSGNNYMTYVNSQTPPLSWPAITGVSGYQVIVFSWKGDAIKGDAAWPLDSQSILCSAGVCSINVPSGLLQPNTPYRFQVRALDSTGQARARSKHAWFYTGAAAMANPINISQANFLYATDGTTKRVWMLVKIPGVAPWDITSLKATSPTGAWPDGSTGQKSFDLAPYQGIVTRTFMMDHFFDLVFESVTPPANGTYTFDVTDKSARTGTKTAAFAYNGSMTGVNSATLSPISNYYADTTTPVFSWGAAPGNPASYTFRIYDYTGEVWYYQATTTGTTYSMPSGILKAGGTYRWRLNINDANGNLAATEQRPITILPAPTSTGASIWGRISRNTSQTGPVRVTLSKLKGDYSPVAMFIINNPGDNFFFFSAVPDGSYMISAYMDVDSDGIYDDTEPYGYYRTETGVREVIVMNGDIQGSEVEWIELTDPAVGPTGISGTIHSDLASAVTGNVMMFRVGDFIRNVYPSTIPESGPGYHPLGGLINLSISGGNTDTNYTASRINPPTGGGNLPVSEGVYDVIFMTGSFDGVARTGSLTFHQRYNNIIVNKGALTGGMNFTIASSATLSGTVMDMGAPSAQAQVLLLAGGPDVYTVAGRGYTDASGKYSFSYVPVGNYTIAVFINGVRVAVDTVNITSPASSTWTKDVAISPLKGDLNSDTMVNLADAILAMQVLAGMQPSGIRASYPISGADVNGDGKIGLEEAIYILQDLSDLRVHPFGTSGWWDLYVSSVSARKLNAYYLTRDGSALAGTDILNTLIAGDITGTAVHLGGFTGTLSGNTITGTAVNNGQTYNFSLVESSFHFTNFIPGESLAAGSAQFAWTTSPGAEKYYILVMKDNPAGNCHEVVGGCAGVWVKDGITDTSVNFNNGGTLLLSEGLIPGNNYRVRVYSRTNSQTGPPIWNDPATYIDTTMDVAFKAKN